MAACSVAEVAGSYGVSWPTAHAAFVEHADARGDVQKRGYKTAFMRPLCGQNGGSVRSNRVSYHRFDQRKHNGVTTESQLKSGRSVVPMGGAPPGPQRVD